jgi:hypothetical protein
MFLCAAPWPNTFFKEKDHYVHNTAPVRLVPNVRFCSAIPVCHTISGIKMVFDPIFGYLCTSHAELPRSLQRCTGMIPQQKVCCGGPTGKDKEDNLKPSGQWVAGFGLVAYS